MLNLINKTDSIITVYNTHFDKNIEAGETLLVTDEMLGGDTKLCFKDLSMNAERIEEGLEERQSGFKIRWRFSRRSSFPLITEIDVTDMESLEIDSSSQRFIPAYRFFRHKYTLCHFDIAEKAGKSNPVSRYFIDKVDRFSVTRILLWELIVTGALLAFLLFASVTAVIEAIPVWITLLIFGGTLALGYYVYHIARNFRTNLKRTVKDYPQYKSRFDV